MPPVTRQAHVGARVKKGPWTCCTCHLGPGVYTWCVASFKGVSVPGSYWRGAALQLLLMHGTSHWENCPCHIGP